MRRKLLYVVLLALCCLSLTGCWNYRGLNDMDIVTGLAVDRDMETGLYQLTFEIADTQNAEGDGEVEAKYVNSEGETVFDAIRNSKKRLINKLYGGNLQTLIISNQIAQKDGVSGIIEELLRDGEPRETLSVVISQEESASEILLTDGIDSKIIAYEIHDMIQEDSKVTASTKNLPLYRVYSAIQGTGNALVLPVVHVIQNGEDTVAEVNGIAMFEGDQMIGYQSPENTMYYLFIIDEIDGGALSFPAADTDESISLEIKNSKTKISVAYEDGQVTVHLNVKIKLNVTESKSQLNISEAKERKQLETLTEQIVRERISAFFHETQTQTRRDIFGLGRLLYQREPDVWRSVEADWQEYFQNASLSVKVTADMISSGVLKDY
ncbi:MAG TPA: Ger(x)C family spore germination protein [Clostridiales bacterium]|nr:Ger(x)C family spore germination protein [Clostridiales bacterium]